MQNSDILEEIFFSGMIDNFKIDKCDSLQSQNVSSDKCDSFLSQKGSADP
jgi:hypothetical protein